MLNGSTQGWRFKGRFWQQSQSWISWLKSDLRYRSSCLSWSGWGIGIIRLSIQSFEWCTKRTRLYCKNFVSNQLRLALFVLAYNLGNFLRRLVLPREIKQWSLGTLLTKLIKIGAKVVRHSRYVTFQRGQGLVANAQQEQRREVAVSRKIFVEILFRIERLRCCPA